MIAITIKAYDGVQSIWTERRRRLLWQVIPMVGCSALAVQHPCRKTSTAVVGWLSVMEMVWLVLSRFHNKREAYRGSRVWSGRLDSLVDIVVGDQAELSETLRAASRVWSP